MCTSGICVIRIATSNIPQSLIYIMVDTVDGTEEYWIFNKDAFESKKCYDGFKKQVSLMEADRVFVGIDENNMLKIIVQRENSTTVTRIPISRVIGIIEKYDAVIKCNDDITKKAKEVGVYV